MFFFEKNENGLGEVSMFSIAKVGHLIPFDSLSHLSKIFKSESPDIHGQQNFCFLTDFEVRS